VRSKPAISRVWRRDLAGWVYLLPFVVGFLVFTFGPVVASFALSFTKYNILQPPQFVGLQNYVEMFGSSQFWNSWRLTIIYAVTTVGLTLSLGLVFALLLHQARRASGFWRTLYYLPAILSGAGEALMLTLVWDRNGLVNSILQAAGITGPAWLQSAGSALPALILSRYWTIGNIILLFLAARAAVPKDLYEVAEIDGASSWATFRAITLPLMTPIILFNLVLGIIASLQVFTQILIMTDGGPAGATRLIGIHIFNLAFDDQRFGYASAVSWSLFAVAVLVSLVLVRTSGRWVYYQFDPRSMEDK
jgi:multiple sugar transport system permease protein